MIKQGGKAKVSVFLNKVCAFKWNIFKKIAVVHKPNIYTSYKVPHIE